MKSCYQGIGGGGGSSPTNVIKLVDNAEIYTRSYSQSSGVLYGNYDLNMVPGNVYVPYIRKGLIHVTQEMIDAMNSIKDYKMADPADTVSTEWIKVSSSDIFIPNFLVNSDVYGTYKSIIDNALLSSIATGQKAWKNPIIDTGANAYDSADTSLRFFDFDVYVCFAKSTFWTGYAEYAAESIPSPVNKFTHPLIKPASNLPDPCYLYAIKHGEVLKTGGITYQKRPCSYIKQGQGGGGSNNTIWSQDMFHSRRGTSSARFAVNLGNYPSEFPNKPLFEVRENSMPLIPWFYNDWRYGNVLGELVYNNGYWLFDKEAYNNSLPSDISLTKGYIQIETDSTYFQPCLYSNTDTRFSFYTSNGVQATGITQSSTPTLIDTMSEYRAIGCSNNVYPNPISYSTNYSYYDQNCIVRPFYTDSGDNGTQATFPVSGYLAIVPKNSIVTLFGDNYPAYPQ